MSPAFGKRQRSQIAPLSQNKSKATQAGTRVCFTGQRRQRVRARRRLAYDVAQSLDRIKVEAGMFYALINHRHDDHDTS